MLLIELLAVDQNSSKEQNTQGKLNNNDLETQWYFQKNP